ncbi:MFS transporter [Sellimonas caecigallum]|uniref:MFS transporter n=1 Tax=Sellimonas caecigallum TaxID=2592333 RepID=A0ABS7L9Z6_9FIRM|nr:MFS transporter [Sellimonas caecigallum]MBY0759921.1 MFS transporter [Sellimonas caecigallum]
MEKKFITNHDFQTLIISILISYVGDTLFDLFIVWKVTFESDSIMNAAYMIGGSLAFRGILALVVGIIIDRFDKKKLMIAANSVSGVIIFLFWCFYGFAIQHISLCIFFILLNDICNTVFASAYTTYAAERFEKTIFIKFQSTVTMFARTIYIVGSAVTGWMITWFSGSGMFLIDTASFFTCAFLISRLCDPDRHAERSSNSKALMISFIKDIKISYRSIFQSSLIRSIVIIMFLLNLAYGFVPNILPIMFSVQSESSITLGLIKSMMAVGEIIGLIIVNQFGHYVSRLFKLAMLVCGACMLCIPISSLFLVGFIFLIYGMFDSLTQPLFSYVITTIDADNRGKILGGIDTLILMSPSIGIAIGTHFLTMSDTNGFLYLSGIFFTALLFLLLNKNLNHIRLMENADRK